MAFFAAVAALACTMNASLPLITDPFFYLVAVPAVLGYNWLLRRNKQALDVLRSFGTALHVAALSSVPAVPK